MNYEIKTIVELKEICKKKKLKNYSKLNKKELISFIKKNIKKGGNGNNKLPKLDFIEKLKDVELKEKLYKLFNSSKYINSHQYFTNSELSNLTSFEQYLIYLNEEFILFSILKEVFKKNRQKEYGIIIYVKNEINHKKNYNKSNNYGKEVKILKINNNESNIFEYLNNLINYFNKYKFSHISRTGHCLQTNSKIRLRLTPKDNNNYNTFSKSEFKKLILCYPNNIYIEKYKFDTNSNSIPFEGNICVKVNNNKKWIIKNKIIKI